MRRRLIVVSNRGPVTYDRDAQGRRVERRGGGGLVTALRGLREQHDVTWVASARSEEDRVVASEGRDDDVVLIAHDPVAYDRYYNRIANPLLWFAQHSLWDLGTRPNIDRGLREAWNGYVSVNRAFAETVVDQLDNSPGAVVFFQDYHLYLAPRLVRDARPDALLAHFVHVPWPHDWSVLPPDLRAAVYAGLLANDVICFHTARWAHNFADGCGDVHGARVTHHALSVDPAEFDALSASDEVLEQEALIAAARPEKLIVRIDRTDPSKNIVRGFEAFALFLEEHPEWHCRVGMLALLDPSRQAVPEYVHYLQAIEREATAVNERFGRDGWLPVDLQVADNFPQSVAAYKQYDVLVVNAVYDGLNLVAKEGPLVNERHGVLLLSENTGAHEELGEWAVTVNPFDIAGQADALYEALTMGPAERRRRAEALAAQVRTHDLAAWTREQLDDFDRASARRGSRNVGSTEL